MKSKQPKKEKAGVRGGRPQPARREPQGDTYRAKKKKVAVKLPTATVCAQCKAVFRDGRWRWPTVPPTVGRSRTLCPACQRIRDGYPAGEVHIGGAFARAHREEVLHRVRNVAEKEQAERPLNRLMAIRDAGEEVVVTTTDIHLAHAIGKALHDAFKGELVAPWSDEGDLLRVRWSRAD